MSKHLIVVTDEENWELECLEPEKCNGWQECPEEHTVDGYEGDNSGPWESDEDAPWYDEEEFEFHGVVHDWNGFGHGWTVPFEGCVVAGAWSYDLPDELWTKYEHEGEMYNGYKVGRWIVEDDWDDTDCYLAFVGPEGS